MSSRRDPKLLVAIGDLHGHPPALARILAALHQRHRVFDRRGRLREGVTLVFTGDYIDRGDGGLAVIAALSRLAHDALGEVVTLLGNHEIMALGALDAAARIASAPGAGDPVALYERWTVHGRNGGGAFVREFDDTPAGALRAYLRRMSDVGDVGQWLRQLRPFHRARMGGARVLLMHGDVSEHLRDAGAFRRYRREVRRVLSMRSHDAGGRACKWGHDLLGDDSIFWSRSFQEIDPADARTAAEVCRSVGADFIVTGHTSSDCVTCRGGRIFDVDVGMTPAYGENEPQALVFEPGCIAVLAASGLEREFVETRRALDRSGLECAVA